jgi:hypothetical protein
LRTKILPPFLPEFTSSGCNEFVYSFWNSKNRPSKAWQSHAMGSGGHQTDSKLASVLANKASIEVENRQNCLTLYGIKGIIASAFADLAK